jgi:hypothetical protein
MHRLVVQKDNARTSSGFKKPRLSERRSAGGESFVIVVLPLLLGLPLRPPGHHSMPTGDSPAPFGQGETFLLPACLSRETGASRAIEFIPGVSAIPPVGFWCLGRGYKGE